MPNKLLTVIMLLSLILFCTGCPDTSESTDGEFENPDIITVSGTVFNENPGNLFKVSISSIPTSGEGVEIYLEHEYTPRATTDSSGRFEFTYHHGKYVNNVKNAGAFFDYFDENAIVLIAKKGTQKTRFYAQKNQWGNNIDFNTKLKDTQGKLNPDNIEKVTLKSTIGLKIKATSKGIPISGAQFRLYYRSYPVSHNSLSPVSDINGNYTITGLIPGTYVIIGNYSGYKKIIRAFPVYENNEPIMYMDFSIPDSGFTNLSPEAFSSHQSYAPVIDVFNNNTPVTSKISLIYPADIDLKINATDADSGLGRLYYSFNEDNSYLPLESENATKLEKIFSHTFNNWNDLKTHNLTIVAEDFDRTEKIMNSTGYPHFILKHNSDTLYSSSIGFEIRNQNNELIKEQIMFQGYEIDKVSRGASRSSNYNLSEGEYIIPFIEVNISGTEEPSYRLYADSKDQFNKEPVCIAQKKDNTTISYYFENTLSNNSDYDQDYNDVVFDLKLLKNYPYTTDFNSFGKTPTHKITKTIEIEVKLPYSDISVYPSTINTFKNIKSEPVTVSLKDALGNKVTSEKDVEINFIKTMGNTIVKNLSEEVITSIVIPKNQDSISFYVINTQNTTNILTLNTKSETSDIFEQITINSKISPVLSFLTPQSTSILTKTSNISWNTSNPDNVLITYDVYYMNEGGNATHLNNTGTDKFLSWDTTNHIDGWNYQIKVIGHTDYGSFETISDPFRILNSYNFPKMHLIDGGTFTAGMTGNRSLTDWAGETLEVTLSSFYLSPYEVTYDDFDKYCELTNKTKPSNNNDSGIPMGRGNNPVVNISFEDAWRFCNWLSEQEKLDPVYTFSNGNIHWDHTKNGFRLPTEAELLFASLGGNTPHELDYPGDSSPSRTGWIESNSNGYVKEVGLKTPVTINGNNFYDLCGNAGEYIWELIPYIRKTDSDLWNKTFFLNPIINKYLTISDSRYVYGGHYNSSANTVGIGKSFLTLTEGNKSAYSGLRLARNYSWFPTYKYKIPKRGEIVSGLMNEIKWERINSMSVENESVDLEISIDSEKTWIPIKTSISNNEFFNSTDYGNTTEAKIKLIFNANGKQITAINDGTFEIKN